MRRYVGWVPVVVLTLAAGLSAGIGLALSHDQSPRTVADTLGCRHVVSGTSATGVHEDFCAYHGDRVIIWTFSRGSNVVSPVSWMTGGVEGPDWIVGCAQAEDCVAIRGTLGGQPLGDAWLGSSIEVR